MFIAFSPSAFSIVRTPERSVGAGPGAGVIAGTITARSAAGVGSSGSKPAKGCRTRLIAFSRDTFAARPIRFTH